MKFRRDVPAFLIAAVTLVVCVMAWLSHFLFSGFTATVEQSQLKLMRQIIEFNLNGAGQKALARAEIVTELPTIKRLFIARDRAGLLAETQRMFQVQKEKYGVDQGQFHVPPATSFLRLHAPEKFGDDLLRSRPLVVAVNRDKTPQAAFGVGYSGPAMFGVVPIKDESGQHVGTYEMGLDLGSVLDGLKGAYGLDLALFVDEKTLHEYAQGVGGDVMSAQNRVGRFIRFHSTNAALLKELVIDQDLDAQDATDYLRTAQGFSYGVVLYPLRNAAGQVTGIIAAAKDFSSSHAADNRTIVWQALMALVSVVVLTGAIVVLLRGFLLAPLAAISARFTALASGEPTTDILDTGHLCEELTELAHQYDRLRTRKEAQ